LQTPTYTSVHSVQAAAGEQTGPKPGIIARTDRISSPILALLVQFIPIISRAFLDTICLPYFSLKLIAKMSDEARPLANFLSGASPQVKVWRIDFEEENLPEYKGLYAVVLDNVLTAEECGQLIIAAERRTEGVWEPALVNVGMGMQELRLDTRNCGRIIWDEHKIVEGLWNRVKSYVPELESVSNAPDITGNGPAKRKETWQMSRLNERMRFLKYGAKQYFRRKYAANHILSIY
jgi:hypothetical protein